MNIFSKVNKMYNVLFEKRWGFFGSSERNVVEDLQKDISNLYGERNKLQEEIELIHKYFNLSKQTITEKVDDEDYGEFEKTESRLVVKPVKTNGKK